MRVVVTKQGIKDAPRGCKECPVERSIKRTLPEADVLAGPEWIKIDGAFYRAPPEVFEFINAYEGWSNGTPRPFSCDFELTNPVQ